MTDITELTSVQKNANIHRLSRLIAYASNDELRQFAVEVEQYTDQLIEALEKAQQRIAELESRTVKLPPCVDDLHGIGMVMSADAVVEALTSYGIKVEAE